MAGRKRLDEELFDFGFDGLALCAILNDPERFVFAGSHSFAYGITHVAYVERSRHVPSRNVDLFVDHGTGVPARRGAYVTEQDIITGVGITMGIQPRRDGSIRIVSGSRDEFVKPHYLINASSRL